MTNKEELYTGIAVTLGDSGTVVLKGDENGVAYEEIKEYVGCDIVTVVDFGHGIDAWVDDEGLLKSGNFVNEYLVADMEAKMPLAGNVIFLGATQDGNTIGLNEEQIEYLSENLSFRLIGFAK